MPLFIRCGMLLTVAFTLLEQTPSRAEPTRAFPYVAYVASPQTYAHCGPGQKYYPTQQLPSGFAVEVYRHDPAGWCAVRPPIGSFSWVAAHEVRKLNDRVVQVAVDDAVVRVGSLLSKDRSSVQVLVHRGEQLNLVAGQSDEDPRWLRVVPPAGEFRWVSASKLSSVPPLESTPLVHSPLGWQASGSGHLANSIVLTQNTAEQQPAFSGQAALPSPQLRATPLAGSQARNLPTATIAKTQVVPGSPASAEFPTAGVAPPALIGGQVSMPGSVPAFPLAKGTLSGSKGPQAPSPRVRFGAKSSRGPTTNRVEELQVRLSQTIIQPKEQWRFEQLSAEATSLLENSDSVTEREHLRDLLDRIAQFKRVQSGQMADAPGASESRSSRPGSEDAFTGQTARVRDLVQSDLKHTGDPFEAATPGTDGPRYDAVGRLKPVVSEQDDAPQFALVDDRGSVVSFVTPTPDLNLQPFVGMRIGVHGSRGFIPEYRRAHVTAGRVTPIEDRLRR